MKRRTFLNSASAAVFLALTATTAIANASTANLNDAAWLGRWDLSFIRADGDLNSVWLFEHNVSGNLSAATIGPNQFGLSFPTLAIEGNNFIFTGISALGATILKGTIANNKMSGTWEAGSQNGAFNATKRADVRKSTPTTLFDQTITTLEAELFTTDRFNDEWRTAKEKARASLTDASTERDLVVAIRTLLRVPKLSHMGFYVLPNMSNEPNKQAIEANANTALVFTSRTLKNNIGYLRISSFAEGATYRAALDAALAEHKNAKGLVLDLRDNPGGSLNLAMRLGDHLFPAKRAFGVFATRKGLAKFSTTNAVANLTVDKVPLFDGYALDDFQRDLKREGALAITSGGRSQTPFNAPIAVLQNERCASTTEALIATLKETKRAKLFGAKTAGAMLSSAEIPVADGYVLRLAYADFRTLAGQSLEGAGIPPDEVVGNGLFGDRVLDRAVAWLGSTQS